MNTLFKYRPLTEFLFKELHYQELYFASYSELNDPFDLSARIEFSCTNAQSVGYLLHFLFKSTFTHDLLIESKKQNLNNLVNFNRDDVRVQKFNDLILKKINDSSLNIGMIWEDDVIEIINQTSEELKLDFEFNLEVFSSKLKRLAAKFLENSYATCFSETNDNFLMWSHYASKHEGICLEFTLNKPYFFSYEMQGRRDLDIEKYSKGYSEWQIRAVTFSDRISKVSYKEQQPFINFFEFSAVFENEHDYDLISLSKSWTHSYADKLESVFSTKTIQWSYEKEWRAIDINFGDPLQPEDRIRHYPIESLKSIYFGMRTPDHIRKRIYNIFKSKRKEIQFFECVPTNGKNIDFIKWESEK